MRNRMKVLFSTFVLMAFAGQAIAAHPCVAASWSMSGSDVSVASMTHNTLGKASAHATPSHDPVCEGDCDAQSALANNPVTLADFVGIDLSKSKNFTPTSAATLVEWPATDHLRGPPRTSNALLAAPTSLFAQHTLLLI